MIKKIKASKIMQECEYTHYIESLKVVVRDSDENNHDVQKLKKSAINQEHNLNECLVNLEHLEHIKRIEEREWRVRSEQLERKTRELKLEAQYHSQTLATSKANIEHSLRMINLFPSSTSDDYLKCTNSNKSISESLKNDWSRVGDQLASSLYELKKLQKE